VIQRTHLFFRAALLKIEGNSDCGSEKYSIGPSLEMRNKVKHCIEKVFSCGLNIEHRWKWGWLFCTNFFTLSAIVTSATQVQLLLENMSKRHLTPMQENVDDHCTLFYRHFNVW